MRRYCIVFFLFFLAPSLRAQLADRVAELEVVLPALTGPEHAMALLAIAEIQLQRERYTLALARAEEGEALARNLRRTDLRARALNIQGKALEKLDRRTLFGRGKAGTKFERSMELSPDDVALVYDNLDHLRQLAARQGDEETLVELEARMERLRASLGGRVLTLAPLDAPAPPRTTTTTTTAAVASPPAGPGRSGPQIATGPSAPAVPTEPLPGGNLAALLAAKEREIQAMSETQMKTELLLMQQRQLVDSMQFRTQWDSLTTANVHLQLREAQSTKKFYTTALLTLLAVALAALYSLVRARRHAAVLKSMNGLLRAERERSDTLLLNILPGLVAEELKQRGRTEARYFDDVGVLFADFVNFSAIAEQLTPQQLVSELDTCFQAFDLIMAKHGLEKIKTIGDAYMCAGGLFADPRSIGGSRLRDLVAAALDIQQWLARWNAQRDELGLPRFEARIGIHRGPVVAGVVGSRKFAFDIWGDTVNIAARIEAAGEGGRVNISGEAYQIVKEYYPCQYRGKLPAKNKGQIDMYFIEN